MEFKAKDIAALLGGVVDGDPEVTVNDVSKIEEGRPGTLAFLANPKYEHYIYTTRASVVLINKTFEPAREYTCTLVRVESAYDAIATLLQMYEDMRPKPVGVEQPSYISESASIGEKPYIGAFAYIGRGAKIGNNVKIYPQAYVGDGVTVGDNTIIYSGVKIYAGCVVGKSCILHSGVVLGADGFGFAPEGDHYKKVPQIGNVVLEGDVEIGANTCVDRATMGSTIIRKGVKLDNLVQIAHNVVVGDNTVIAAQTGIAGTTKIGEHCVFGGQVGIVGHLTIGSDVQIGAQSGITSNVPDKSMLRGAPAFDYKKYQKCYVVFRKLPELYGQIKDLEKEVANLKSK